MVMMQRKRNGGESDHEARLPTGRHPTRPSETPLTYLQGPTNSIPRTWATIACEKVTPLVIVLANTVFSRSLTLLALATASLAEAADFPSSSQTFLEQHCFECHDSDVKKGGLDLTTLSLDTTDPLSLTHWTHVHDRVLSGEMPPAKKARPEAKQIADFTQQAADALSAAWASRYAENGRTPLRRLNPTEFEHTMRDLLAAPWLEIRDILPPDPETEGFDNVAAAQELSYVQMARFLEAIEIAIDSAMQLRPHVAPTDLRLWFGEEGRFRGKGEFEGQGSGDVRMIDEWTVILRQPNSAQAPWRIDNKRQHEPGWYRFRVRCRAVHFKDGQLLPPQRGHVAAINTAAQRVLGSFDVPTGPEGGIVEFTAWQHQDDLLEFHCSTLDDRNMPNAKKNPVAPYEAPGIAVDYFEIDGPYPTADCDPATVGQPPESYRRLFGDLPTAPWTRDSGLNEPERLHIPDLTANKRGLRDSFMPVPGQMHVVSKDPHADAERLLRDFMARAYRGSVAESEVQRCLAFAKEAIDGKACFQDAMRLAYKAALCSPDFLYFQESPGPLSDLALASRLSYFLWRTQPDQTLREAAASGQLQTDEGLLNEMDRLLADPKAARFITDFTAQWLDLRKINDTTPDRHLYPEYFCDTHIMDSAVAETEATFAAMLAEDLPASTIIDSDFAIINERLSQVYGIEGIHGKTLQRVSLPPDSPHGGLITQCSVMKVTANGLTTSPVLRGVWLLERILGTPPSPPPPNAGAIDPDTRGATTVREQLDKHRRSESCASCHVSIDPPGFALESFDVMGAWRDRYRSFEEGDPLKLKIANRDVKFKLGPPVDASGTSEDGQAFKDIHDFRRILLQQEEQIARNLTERFLTFATAAAPTFADRPVVEGILKKSRPAGYGVRSLLREVVLSPTFRRK